MVWSMVIPVADPETSERGGGKKHEIKAASCTISYRPGERAWPPWPLLDPLLHPSDLYTVTSLPSTTSKRLQTFICYQICTKPATSCYRYVCQCTHTKPNFIGWPEYFFSENTGTSIALSCTFILKLGIMAKHWRQNSTYDSGLSTGLTGTIS